MTPRLDDDYDPSNYHPDTYDGDVMAILVDGYNFLYDAPTVEAIDEWERTDGAEGVHPFPDEDERPDWLDEPDEGVLPTAMFAPEVEYRPMSNGSDRLSVSARMADPFDGMTAGISYQHHGDEFAFRVTDVEVSHVDDRLSVDVLLDETISTDFEGYDGAALRHVLADAESVTFYAKFLGSDDPDIQTDVTEAVRTALATAGEDV
jgi:hypothetical protein